MILASQIWTDVFWTSVVAGGLLAGLPLMFTALGETISERAGVLNIGLEGMMLLGAYLGFVGAHDTGSVWVGFLSGIGAGMIGAVLMIVLCVWLGLDQIVVGIAITLGCEGITSVLQQAQFGSTYPRLGAAPTVSIPLLHRLPVLGTSLFEQPPLVYLAFAFVGALAWMFRRTNVGLNLRAAGEKPEALDAAGVSVVATRSWAVLSTGALAGLGGAYLSDRRRRDLHALHHPGAGLHGDRDRHARTRPAALGAARLVPLRDRPLALGLAPARRDQHLDGCRQHAPVRDDHHRADRCSPAARTFRPPLRCRTSAARAERRPNA